MTKLTFEELTAHPEPLCGETRGRRGRVHCEKHVGHGDDHAGRGRLGQWFFWRTS